MDASLFSSAKLPDEQTFSEWLSFHLQPMPIQGWVVLCVRDNPIDFRATVGSICVIARDGVRNDVYEFAHKLGLFGIYAGWFDGMTYVATVN